MIFHLNCWYTFDTCILIITFWPGQEWYGLNHVVKSSTTVVQQHYTTIKFKFYKSSVYFIQVIKHEVNAAVFLSSTETSTLLPRQLGYTVHIVCTNKVLFSQDSDLLTKLIVSSIDEEK